MLGGIGFISYAANELKDTPIPKSEVVQVRPTPAQIPLDAHI
jgi:hypothetical protein